MKQTSRRARQADGNSVCDGRKRGRAITQSRAEHVTAGPATARSVRVPPARLALFASGDFACNLYWQSVTLFLFFFYTDALRLAPATAGLVVMLGALWDGLADLLVGAFAQTGGARYRRIVSWGAAPLALSFVLLWCAPGWDGGRLAVWAAATQIAFRGFYALVNVPYAAWSTRVSADSADRTLVAGLRMLFGALAAFAVTLGEPVIARAAGAGPRGAAGFLATAGVLALTATPLLWAVARWSPEAAPASARTEPAPLVLCLAALARNRAFVALNLAAMAAGFSAAMLNQSVLFYFSDLLRGPAEGPHALALMAAAGTLAVPLWTTAATRIGGRAAWLAGAGLAGAALLGFGLSPGGARSADAFLVAMQAAFAAFNLCFWALLPDSVDYGERHGGVRVEALAFGVAALLQRLALALAGAAFGFAYQRIGYAPGAAQSPGTLAGIRAVMLAGPALGVMLGALAMAANPLRRGARARVTGKRSDRHQVELSRDPIGFG